MKQFIHPKFLKLFYYHEETDEIKSVTIPWENQNKNKKLFDLIDTEELHYFLTIMAAEEENLIMQEDWIDSSNPLLSIQKEMYQKLKLHEDKVLFAKTAASQYAISQSQKTLGELVEQYGIVELNQYFKEYEIIE